MRRRGVGFGYGDKLGAVALLAVVLPTLVFLVKERTELFSRAAGPASADVRFGTGVATHGGSTASDNFGYSAINQNKIDALAGLGLNPGAKTWSVFQLEPNTDINFLLASYNSYPSYSQYTSANSNVMVGYDGKSWNTVSSTVPGIPGVGTFVVTHIVMNRTLDFNLCGTDGYCIYGLSGQPIAWGQDTAQAGGLYLDQPANTGNIPLAWKQYFKGLGSDYNPVGMMNINGGDLYSSYPNYASFTVIHDIRVPKDWWQGGSSGNIVYGGLYNPKVYKGKAYSEGALTYFLKTYPGKTYALFNLPTARMAKWDGDPTLPESYSWLLRNFMVDYVQKVDPGAKIQVHVSNDPDLDGYLSRLIADYKKRLLRTGETDIPVDYWSFGNYPGPSDPPSSGTDLEKVLYGLTFSVEKQVKILSKYTNKPLRLIEVTVNNNFDLYGASSRIPGASNSTYGWEKSVYFRMGKWLKSLSAAYPKLEYYSLQPTFHIPEYMDSNLVPARYSSYPPGLPRTYAQVLSPTGTGTAEGWSSAAQPGASAIYLKDTAMIQQTACNTHVEAQYFSDDGIIHAAEGVGEIQIVMNLFPDWTGTKVTGSATKYGVRAMYTPVKFGAFAANTYYVQEENCTGCIYGWKPITADTWYRHSVLKYKLKFSPAIISGKKAELKVDIQPLAGSPMLGKSLNVYTFAEKNSTVAGVNPRIDLFDPSAGFDSTYDFARFKKMGIVNLSTNCSTPPVN